MTDHRGVSFVVTVYNKEPYIEATLRSLFAQEGEFEREVIVVDDGSTDRSPEIVRDLLGPIKGGRYIGQDNSGPSRALNVGVRAAGMPIIKPMDGDDVLTDDAVDRLLAGFRWPEVALVHGRRDLFSNVDGDSAVRSTETPVFTVLEDPLWHCVRHSLSGCSEVIFRRDAFVSSGGCDESVFIQDQSFIWRMAIRHWFALTRELIAFSPDPDSGSLMVDRPQIEHDRNAAITGLIRDHPELPLAIKRLSLRRVSGRARKWAQRVNKKPFGLDLTFWINGLSYLPWLPRYDRLLELSCQTYYETTPVRRPTADTKDQRSRKPVRPPSRHL